MALLAQRQLSPLSGDIRGYVERRFSPLFGESYRSAKRGVCTPEALKNLRSDLIFYAINLTFLIILRLPELHSPTFIIGERRQIWFYHMCVNVQNTISI